MLRTVVLSRTVDGRGRITRTGMALFCAFFSILWLGAHSCIETVGASRETTTQTVLPKEQEEREGAKGRGGGGGSGNGRLRIQGMRTCLSPDGGDPRRQVHHGLVCQRDGPDRGRRSSARDGEYQCFRHFQV